MLLLAATVVLLFGWQCHAELSAQVDVAGVVGSVTINTDRWLLRTSLNGTCGPFNISVHEFPILHGESRDPCDARLIGRSIGDDYILTNGTGLSLVDLGVRYDGRSLVLKTCGMQICVNLMGGSQRFWVAVAQSFIIGQIFLMQSANFQAITAFAQLALLEGKPESNATIFFTDACHLNDLQNIGVAQVGQQQRIARSRLELTTTSVMSYLVIQYGDRWTCAEVKAIQAKEAAAYFSMQGINGTFSFRQESPFHETQVTVDLWRLRSLAGQYKVNSLPVLPLARRCDEASTGQLYNPLAMVIASTPTVHSSWPIGNLSGRHGGLQGRDRYKAVLLDWNLPLFGNNSIIGRSIVIQKTSGEPWACSTIRLGGDVVTATATFHKEVVGRIMFQQTRGDPSSDLSIYVELTHASSPMSRNHNWHVHEFPLSPEYPSCATAGGHFNPHSVPTAGNYSLECSPSNPLRCEAGDYAGKHAQITLLAPSPARYLFTDSMTSLSGPASIVGRSVVIHGPEGTSPRLACANILLQPPHEGQTELWFGPGDSSGVLQATQASELDPTVIGITFDGLKGQAGGFHIHILPVVSGGPDSPCADGRIQGHFNPFAVNVSSSPMAGNGTDDEYEVGDISGRHGSLLSLTSLNKQFQDTNFPLSGPYSVLGRSLVIHYANSSRMQCATFQRRVTSGGEWIHAVATFSGEINGTITVSQIVYPEGGASDATIMTDLRSDGLDKSSALSWAIRPDSRSRETYNPYKIPDQGGEWCNPQLPRLCGAGDLTGKHGTLTVGKGLLLTDINLPLGGSFTVLGRTVALSWGSSEITAPLRPTLPTVLLRFQSVADFNLTSFQSAVSAALNVPAWRVALLPAVDAEGVESCQQREFFVLGFNDSAALTSLQTREFLGPYCIVCCPQGLLPSGSTSIMIPPNMLLMMILPLTLGLLLLTYPSP